MPTHSNNRVMLITGASTGIGAATARLAAERGYQLALLARSQDKLDALKAELPGNVLAITADVTSPEHLKSAVEAVNQKFGRIDVVFANAGIGGSPGGFTGADPESWKNLLMTNVYGLALTLQCTAPALKASKGHVIITGSVAGRRSLKGSMYAASKWAVTGIGHGFRKEINEHGVRVTLIEPGLVNTPFFDEAKEGVLEGEDVARAVLYAIEQPSHMEVHELLLMPTSQGGDNAVP